VIQNSETISPKLLNQVKEYCQQIANSKKIKAIYLIDNFSNNGKKSRKQIEAVLIIKDFQPRISTNVRSFNQSNITVFAVDQWIFERDTQRGFLGESLSGNLVFSYFPILGKNFLFLQEICIKKRLIIEMLENIVQNYPKLSYNIKIKPEYFMYKAILDRVKIFPPLYNSLSDLITKSAPQEKVDLILSGYIKAITELENENKLFFSNNFVSLKKQFIEKNKNPTKYIKNLGKVPSRGIFTSFFSVYSQLLKLFSQRTNILLNFRKFNNFKGIDHDRNIVNPQEYLFIQINHNICSLANGADMLTFAKRHLPSENKADIKFDSIGGILNDVYIIRTLSENTEKKILVKQFKEWSGFKWFPLSLWAIGTRNLSVLAKTRLANDYSINEFLRENGFRVPKILHVSLKKRLLFMEYIEGIDLSILIKNILNSTSNFEAQQDLSIIYEAGNILAKIHSINVTLGDTKPENVLLDLNRKIYLVDFEQASHGGDKTWDLAVFLYFMGHYIPPFTNKQVILNLVNAFLDGYLQGGGNIEDINKVSSPKYSRLFSIYVLPNVLMLISQVCKKAKLSKQT